MSERIQNPPSAGYKYSVWAEQRHRLTNQDRTRCQVNPAQHELITIQRPINDPSLKEQGTLRSRLNIQQHRSILAHGVFQPSRASEPAEAVPPL
jgi:hypothetical protein